MALKVWLPLNGNLENQGLFQLPASPSTSSISYTDGKIGRAASGYCIYHLSSDIIQNKWSLACWCYSSAWGQYNNILLCNNTKDSQDCRFYFSIIGGSSLNIGINGPSSTASFGFQFSTNTWYHVAATYDGTNYALYINGAKVKSGKCTTAIVSNKLNLGIGGRSMNENGTSATGASTRLNDVRIYDHALSAKEVGELAKGLVLHYRLAGPGGMNMISNFDTSFNTTAVGVTTLFENQMNNGTQEILSSFANRNKVLHLHSNGGSNRMYRYYAVTSGKSYTVSLDYYSTSTHNTALYCELNGGNYNWLGSGCAYSTPGVWKRLSTTYTNITSNANLYIFIMCNTNADCYVKNIKLEEGQVATPWCPNSSDALYTALGYNNNIEDDCSGYSRNGTKSGTIICDSDSPRYATSYKFGSTSTKIKATNFGMSGFANSYSFSWWQKNTGSGNMPWGFSDGNRLNLYHTTNLCWNTGDGGSNPFKYSSGAAIPNTRLCDSAWHHCVVTGNGSTTKLYIDGIYAGIATTYKAITGTQIYISGWDTGTSYTFSGSNLSDFRIYATVLSDADILELYEAGGAIDSHYNSYAYEYITDDSNEYLNSQGISGISDLEETDENTKWLSTGKIESNNFYEI